MSPRRALVLAAACLVAVAVAACGGDDGGGGDLSIGPNNEVAIEVGDQKILNGEIERRAIFLATAPTGNDPVEPPARDSEEFREFRVTAAEQLRDERVYGNLARACGAQCRVTDKEVNSLLADIREQQFNGSQAEFDTALEARGITLADLRRSLRASQQQQKLEARERAKVRYTDAEGLAYYRKNIANYRLIAEKRLSHILLDTRAEALAVRAEATADNFAELARERSKDPAARTPGGEDLGSITSGSLLPELQTAATRLTPGEVSPPVQSQFGWHLLLVEDIKARTKAYAEVENEIRTQELAVKQEAAVQRWRDTAVKRAQDAATFVNAKVAPEQAAASAGTTTAAGATTQAGATTTAPGATTGATGPATP